MKFKIVNGILTVKSESGKTYTLDEKSCSCTGFGYRGKCKHHDLAKKKNLFQSLVKPKGFTFVRTSFVIESRKSAIRQWLIKNGHKVAETIVNRIESIMTPTTDMRKIIACIKKS